MTIENEQPRKATLPNNFFLHNRTGLHKEPEAEGTISSAEKNSDDIIAPYHSNSSVVDDVRSPAVNSSDDEDICKTPECERLALAIMSTIDQDQDPCQDFYHYACGRVSENSSLLFQPEKNIKQRILQTLSSWKAEVPPSWNLLNDFYHQCLSYSENVSDITKRVELFVSSFREVGNFDEAKEDSELDLTSLLSRMIQRHSTPVFDVLLDLNRDHPGSLRFKLTPPTYQDRLSLIGRQQLNCSIQYPHQHDNYRNCLKEGAYIKQVLNEALDALCARLNQTGMQALIYAAAETVFDEIAQDLWTGESSHQFRQMTINEMNEEFPGIDWSQLMNQLTGNATTSEDSVNVYLPEYMTKIISVLTQDLHRAFVALLALHAAYEYANIVLPDTHQQFCLDVVVDLMPDVAHAIYLSTLDVDAETEKLNTTFHHLKSTLSQLMKDELYGEKSRSVTADFVENKLDFARYLNLVEDRWKDFHLAENYAKSFSTLVKRHRSHIYSSSKKLQFVEIMEAVWVLCSLQGCFNQLGLVVYEENKIVVPLSIGETYDTSHPAYWNMGRTGFLVARQLMHHYDLIGNRDGVSDTEWNGIMEQMRRWIVDYTEHQSTSVAYSKEEIDWLQNELYADREGLRLAFETYVIKFAQKEDRDLPFLNLTDAQLFFLAASQLHCTVDEEAQLSNILRIRSMVAHSEEFRKAYNCPSPNDKPLLEDKIWLDEMKRTLSHHSINDTSEIDDAEIPGMDSPAQNDTWILTEGSNSSIEVGEPHEDNFKTTVVATTIENHCVDDECDIFGSGMSGDYAITF